MSARDCSGVINGPRERHAVYKADTGCRALQALRSDGACVGDVAREQTCCCAVQCAINAGAFKAEAIARCCHACTCLTAPLNEAVIVDGEVITSFRQFNRERCTFQAFASIDDTACQIVEGEVLSRAICIDGPVALCASGDNRTSIVQRQASAINVERTAIRRDDAANEVVEHAV